jgi:hypothetical protein
LPLPATYADALHEEMVSRAVEALQVATRGWGLSVSLDEAIEILINYMRRGPKQQQDITLNAERGDYVSHLAIERFYRDLMLTHEMPSVPIVAYVMDPRRHPRKPRGGAWWENMRRDIIIASITDWLCRHYGISPRRTPAMRNSRKAPCGASILAAAFTRCGHKIDEGTVANVLSRRTEWGGALMSLLEYVQVEGGMSRVRRLLSP